MGEHIFFLVGLAFILTHEMDVIRSHEWTIFPLLSRLEEKAGYICIYGVTYSLVSGCVVEPL